MDATDILNRKVLVLNKSWQPINIVSAFKAICKVFTGNANIVDTNYCEWTFDEWVNNWEDLSDIPVDERDDLVNTAKLQFPVPEIIVTTRFTFKHHKVRLTRKNIFIRDNYICQYCHKQFSSKDLTIDHVIPRAKGGTTRWVNVATACGPCNTKKADHLAENIGMKLLKVPKKPHWSLIAGKITTKPPKSWQAFVSEMYWNAELEE